HDRGNHDVGTVVLLHECDQGKRYAGDRRCDQQQQPELDHRLRLEPQRVGNDIRNGLECIGLPMKYAVVRDPATMQREKEGAAYESHHRRYDHSPAQQISDEELHVLVAPPSCTPQRLAHMPPRSPLYAISTARNTITIVKIVRSARTLAPARTRAPVSAPASTPSMTGNASTGSMYPRCR